MYVGRFAPSPTGPLHFGSLTTALASYLEARRHGGRWLVRIEDIDPPREQPGAAAAILKTLETLGLHWDGEVLYQSTRAAAYAEALGALAGAIYPCTCSRSEIAAGFEAQGLGGPFRYPGTCRTSPPRAGTPAALRFAVDDAPVAFLDTLQGRQTCRPGQRFGDFVLRRRDQLFAYQLAVVVDDGAQGVTNVVRGTDLLTETFKQLVLQRTLGYPHPRYMHVPIATHANGQKLSKQSGAAAVDAADPTGVLLQALRFLRQSPPQHLSNSGTDDVLAWAIAHWQPEVLLGTPSISIERA